MPLPSRAAGVVTVVLSIMASLVVVTPVHADQPVPVSAILALGGPAPIITLAVDEALPVIGSTTSTVPALPDAPPPAADAEILALAGRPVPGASPSGTLSAGPVDETVPEVEDALGLGDADGDGDGTLDLLLYAFELEGVSSIGVASEEALLVTPIPEDAFECHDRASVLPLKDENGRYDRNLVAQMTHTLFECVASVNGYAERDATSNRSWDGAGVWGFENMAEQIAAEAVVVGYCESQAFAPHALTSNNPWGYGGVFQMGGREMRMFGFSGASKFDPVDNVYAAATYFMWGAGRGHAWGGWGPWAVVNTGYNDEINDKVKIPVLPRFVSTDPSYRGRRGVELPEWGVDPWSYQVPGFNGCPFTGRSWPASAPLEEG